MKNSKLGGFTLVEILIVISIIGILTTLAILSFGSTEEISRNNTRLSDVKQIQLSLEEYYKYENAYPSELVFGDKLTGPSTGKTFLNIVPKNPEPRDDGDCPDQEYQYTYDSSTKSYSLKFCLSTDTSNFEAEGYKAVPYGIVSSWACGDALIDSRDSQQYPTVQIGTQCWMAKNLNVGTKIDSPILQSSAVPAIEKYCYDNATSNCDLYGGSYMWDEAMGYVQTKGTQGICPKNWHIPSLEEWSQLSTYLGGNQFAGGKLKATGTTLWVSPNVGATNEVGFTVLPGGGNQVDYENKKYFRNINSVAWFWTSDVLQNGRIAHVWMSSDNAYFSPWSYYTNDQSMSIRCIKN